ncbi:MAG: VWA domain-containing protein [Bdellovibrionaceae bacterium]|nr:VWA domain-containing protein [Pseudobdellovibrionaceae bacterium]NUM57785.1 VWA domain-containing protein [Pseudobdellovibrionaceae bacterium]
MSLKNPEYLFLLIPLFLSLGFYFWTLKKRTPSLQFSSLDFVRNRIKTLRIYLQYLPLFLKIISLILILYALARPQLADTKVKKNVEGIDIVIALDISDSMLIEDMKPLNRLESAKEKIKDFVSKRTSDKIGVVIFAGEAFTLVPPTLDYELLLTRISEITTAQNARIKEGTALGVGLANAVARLKDSQAKTRIVVFMTDGENNSGTIDPETGLELAKGYGLKIYSIGIGKDGPTRIPVYTRDFMGNKIKTYQPFESTVNEDLLQKMASETGGKYFRASKEDSLKGIFDEIDKLEKTKMDVNKYTKYTELFQRYLFWAIIFYLGSWILSLTWLRKGP